MTLQINSVTNVEFRYKSQHPRGVANRVKFDAARKSV